MGYTKGEWKALPTGQIEYPYYIDAPDKLVQDYTSEVAKIYRVHTVYNAGAPKANANLIAAAPDMYEALFIGLDLVKQTLYEHPDDEVAQAQKEVIEKALAKAEGKEGK